MIRTQECFERSFLIRISVISLMFVKKKKRKCYIYQYVPLGATHSITLFGLLNWSIAL